MSRFQNKQRRRMPRPGIQALRDHLGEPEVCHLCGDPLDWELVELDHLLPVAQGGTNDPSNLAWIHRPCNYVKGYLRLDELLPLLERILAHQRRSQ